MYFGTYYNTAVVSILSANLVPNSFLDQKNQKRVVPYFLKNLAAFTDKIEAG